MSIRLTDVVPADPESSVIALTNGDADVTCTIAGDSTMKHTVTWSIGGTIDETATTVLDPGVLGSSIVLSELTVAWSELDVSSNTIC